MGESPGAAPEADGPVEQAANPTPITSMAASATIIFLTSALTPDSPGEFQGAGEGHPAAVREALGSPRRRGQSPAPA